jgi:hypothetical protein
MSVELGRDGSIRLAGTCPLEDAEPLLRLVLDNPSAPLDWRACSRAHAAVIQVLLAARPRLLGPPADPFLRVRIEPLLSAGAAGPHAPVAGPSRKKK